MELSTPCPSECPLAHYLYALGRASTVSVAWTKHPIEMLDTDLLHVGTRARYPKDGRGASRQLEPDITSAALRRDHMNHERKLYTIFWTKTRPTQKLLATREPSQHNTAGTQSIYAKSILVSRSSFFALTPPSVRRPRLPFFARRPTVCSALAWCRVAAFLRSSARTWLGDTNCLSW
jgi:hypothetical protein